MGGGDPIAGVIQLLEMTADRAEAGETQEPPPPRYGARAQTDQQYGGKMPRHGPASSCTRVYRCSAS